MKNRESIIPNWHLDMLEIVKYWDGNQRAYHHTAPINMLYALYQSLLDVAEEGIDNVIKRHKRVHDYLESSLSEISLKLIVDKNHRLPSLNAIEIPSGVNDLDVRSTLLNDYNIEIGGGLGPFAGKVWRIGLMGHSAYEKNVDTLISALNKVL